MNERIQEVLRLIDVQLALVPDNPIEEQYKARTLAIYVQTLNGFWQLRKHIRRKRMSEFEIRIPARKKQPATDKDNPVVKVSAGAYNALVEIYNESTLSMKDIASLLIVEGSKHVVYDKEE